MEPRELSHPLRPKVLSEVSLGRAAGVGSALDSDGGQGEVSCPFQDACEVHPLSPLIPALFRMLAGSVFLVYNVSRKLYHAKTSEEQQAARGSEAPGAEPLTGRGGGRASQLPAVE